MLPSKLGPAASLYVVRKCPHGLLGDFDSVAPINRGFRHIGGGQDFATATFVLDPQRHCGLHGVLGALIPAAQDRLTDKILLLGREVYVHLSKLAGST
jgi:hypothetical protein